MIPKISRFPFFGKRFFKRVRKLIGSCHYSHFWRLVILIASDSERCSLKRCQEVSGKHRTRQAISFFLTRADWDAPEVLRQKALDTLRDLGWRAGESVYLILDDTQKRKRAKRMDAVSKLFLHAEKVYATGHTIVGCALLYRGVVIPYAVRLWANEDFCARSARRGDEEPVEFQKITAIAAQMVEELSLPGNPGVIVLFDAYYLCSAVVRACETRKFGYVGVAKRNRNFFPDGRDRDKRKVGRYGANVLAKDGRLITVQGKKHRLAQRVGRLSKLGRVKLVFSRRPSERGWIAMATNRLRWGVKTVLTHYLKRWGIEVFWKMSKQYLGLGDYQVLRYRAVERYLHLVLIAHLLLTHLAVTTPDAKAQLKDKHKDLPLPSVPQLQQETRALLLKDVIQSMERGSHQRKTVRKLKDVLQF